MKYIILAAALVLSGCAGTKMPPSIQIPISEPCKTEDPLQPTYRYVPPYENVFDAVRDLLGDRELSTAYEIEQRAALKSCK
jgi:hypothetical protein